MTNSSRPLLNVQHALLFIFAGWMIFNIVQSVQYIVADYSGIPIQDYWRVPELWPQYKAFRFSALWRQHNEHRIIFPELTYIADMFLFRGRMYLPIVLSGICYLGVWFVLVWAAYSSKLLAWPYREIALLLGGVVMTWKGCSSVIATPFQLQFTMLQLSSVLTLVALVKLAETGRSRFLAMLIVFAAVGTYCSGNGMLLWPVLIAGAFLLKISRAQIAFIALAAVVFTGLYFVGYQFQPSNMSVNLRHPLLELAFLCSYMSMPFGSFGPPQSGIAIGAIHLLLMLGCCILALRPGTSQGGMLKTRLGIIVFGLYVFTLLSAMLTTAGRLDLKEHTFWAAKAWRYMTMPMMAWALLVIALIWFMGETAWRSRTLIASAIIAVFFFWGFQRSARWMETTRVDFGYAQVVATMLRNQIFDPVTLLPIFPSSDFARHQLAVLEADRKGPYARGADKWIGQNVDHLYPDRQPVPGTITRVYPVPGGLEILGWVDNSWLSGDHPVLFVDEATGKIAGYGKRPPAGFPPRMAGWDMPAQVGFVGFIHLDKSAGQRFLVYSRTFRGKLLQPVRSIINTPAFEQVPRFPESGLLAGISWQPGDAWTLNGYKPDPQNGSLPIGQVYGSGPEEKKTGVIQTAPFAAPPNHCIVLSVLHGPSTYGQSVEVQDADTKTTLVNLPMLESESIWTKWRITLPNATRNVTIIGDDEGRESFQWTALASPQECP